VIGSPLLGHSPESIDHLLFEGQTAQPKDTTT